MTQEQRHAAKAQRQNTRDGATIVAFFFGLVCANMWGFREDGEMVAATTSFFTLLIHRIWPTI